MSFVKFRNQFYVKKFSAFFDLPVQHCNNLTKLMSKLQQIEFGKTFKTMLDKLFLCGWITIMRESILTEN